MTIPESTATQQGDPTLNISQQPHLFAKVYMSVLMLFVGLNGIRVGEFGLGVFGMALLLVAVVIGILACLLLLKTTLTTAELLAFSVLFICGIWAAMRGDGGLFSSLLVLILSYIVIHRWVRCKSFLFRYVYAWPLVVGTLFYILYVLQPALVYQPIAGGKYVQVAGFTLFRFEGAVLNANSYGIATAVLLFCMRYLGIARHRLTFGYLSLMLSFSYSGFISYFFLVAEKLSGKIGRVLSYLAVIAILPTYGLVKGWSLLESIRIIKYGFYFSKLLTEPLSAILWGGIDRTGHAWVVLTDNAVLTMIYDHGLIFVLAYFAAFWIVMRKHTSLFLIFLLMNLVVDLQYFWPANLMFLVAAKLMGSSFDVSRKRSVLT